MTNITIDPVSMAHRVRLRPISGITPFTYRDGITYLRLLEDLIEFVNKSLVSDINVKLSDLISQLNTTMDSLAGQIVENEQAFTDLLSEFMDEIDRRVDTINDKTGPLGIQRFTLTDDRVLDIDVTWPNSQPLHFQVTQDSAGEHLLLFGDGISNPDDVTINTEPGAMTEFVLMPNGDGTWRVTDNVSLIRTEISRVETEIDQANTDLLALSDELVIVETGIRDDLGILESAIRETVQTTFTHRFVGASGVIREHYITEIHGGLVPGALIKRLGNMGGPAHTVKPMSAFIAETGANLITTGSGWRSTGQMMGLQIANGNLYRGWDTITYDDHGRQALVVMRDGSFRIYDENTPPEQILTDGGYHSFSWGHAAYRNGQWQDTSGYDTAPLVSARHLIGDTLDGRIVLATFPGITGVGGATYAQALDNLSGYSWNNLFFLDGGGSAQTYVDGFRMVRSSDPTGYRDVADVIGFRGRSANPVPTVWTPVDIRLDGYTGGIIGFMEEPGQTHIRCQSLDTTGAPFEDYSAIMDMPEWAIKPFVQSFDVGRIGPDLYPLWVNSSVNQVQFRNPTGGGSMAFYTTYQHSRDAR